MLISITNPALTVAKIIGKTLPLASARWAVCLVLSVRSGSCSFLSSSCWNACFFFFFMRILLLSSIWGPKSRARLFHRGPADATPKCWPFLLECARLSEPLCGNAPPWSSTFGEPLMESVLVFSSLLSSAWFAIWNSPDGENFFLPKNSNNDDDNENEWCPQKRAQLLKGWIQLLSG